MWLGQTYDFAWCVIVFTICGELMDLFGGGPQILGRQGGCLAYVALLMKYCQDRIILDLWTCFLTKEKHSIAFSLFSYTGLVPTIYNTKVVSNCDPLELALRPEWEGDSSHLDNWYQGDITDFALPTIQRADVMADGFENPSDLFLLDGESFEAFHRNLSTRSHDDAGKAIFPLALRDNETLYNATAAGSTYILFVDTMKMKDRFAKSRNEVRMELFKRIVETHALSLLHDESAG